MKVTRGLSVAICFLLIPWAACRKTLETSSWETEILAPLVHTTLTLQNLLGDTLFQTNSDSSLTLVYENALYRFSLDTLLDVPDTTIDTSFYLPVPLPIPPGIPFVGDTDATQNDLGGPELTYIEVKSGITTIEITNRINEVILFTYSIPGAEKQGIPFSISTQIPPGTPANPSSVSQMYDLAGYGVNLTGKDGKSVNTLMAVFQAMIDPAGDTTTVSPSDSLSVTYNFAGLVPSYARGYLGQYFSVIGPDSEIVTSFQNITGGSFNIDSFSMTLRIENGFGADAQMTVKELSSVNTASGKTVPLNHSIVGTSVNINRATQTPSPGLPFTPSEYLIQMNNQNSNADAMAENMPNQIRYAFDVAINPLGNISAGNDFIYYESELVIWMDLMIPLAANLSNLVLTNTTDFSLDVKNIQGGNFYLYAWNGFPAEIEIQLYPLGAGGNIIDSLLSTGNNLIAAAPVGQDLKVTAQKFSMLTIPADKDKLNRVAAATKVITKARFATIPAGKTIPFYSGYKLELKLTGDFIWLVNN